MPAPFRLHVLTPRLRPHFAGRGRTARDETKLIVGGKPLRLQGRVERWTADWRRGWETTLSALNTKAAARFHDIVAVPEPLDARLEAHLREADIIPRTAQERRTAVRRVMEWRQRRR